jgi:hypothetical protein
MRDYRSTISTRAKDEAKGNGPSGNGASVQIHMLLPTPK